MAHLQPVSDRAEPALSKSKRERRIQRVFLIAFAGIVASLLSVATITPAGAQTPTCESSSSDPDGDGWGWENNASCKVSTSTPATPTSSSHSGVCTSADADPDGDGWGWENGQSCTMPAGVRQVPANSQPCWTIESFAAGCNVSGGPWTPAFTAFNNRFRLASSAAQTGALVEVISDVDDIPFNNKVLYIVGPYLADPTNAGYSTAEIESNVVLNTLAPAVGAMRAQAQDQGTTVVYVGFGSIANSETPVSMRVVALKQAIRGFENARPNKSSGADSDSMLIGISLGGIAGKQALYQLEQENFDHGVDTYVSWDSPHNGAHIPQSLQEIPFFLSRFLNKVDRDTFRASRDVTDAKEFTSDFINRSLGSPVAKDVLVINRAETGPNGATGLDSPMPTRTHNVAVASGATDGTRPALNENVLTIETGESGRNQLKSYINATVTIPDADGSVALTAVGSYLDPISGFLKINDRKYVRATVSVSRSTALAYDRAPCGFQTQLIDQIDGVLSELLADIWSNPSISVNENRMCFVPTSSAIGIAEETVAFGTVTGVRRFSIFDQILGDSVNNEHMQVTTQTENRAVQLVADSLN